MYDEKIIEPLISFNAFEIKMIKKKERNSHYQ